MKFSIIGSGFILPKHLDAIKAINGEIVGITEISHGEESWREAVKKKESDCVVILTPNYLHFEMALEAANNGKIVLCEKPLTIKSEDAKILATKPHIFTVLQLRHHSLIQKLKSEISFKDQYDIEVDISVTRDTSYLKNWQADKEKSGGILFNIGIHYIDLILYLFGEVDEIITAHLDEKNAHISIKGINYHCAFRFSINLKNPCRILKINDEEYNLSLSGNLNDQYLYRYIYQDLLLLKGITPGEALKSILLAENSYKKNEQIAEYDKFIRRVK